MSAALVAVAAAVATVAVAPAALADILPPQCADGIDNDLNGSADYPNDPGCSSPGDLSEASSSPNCTLVNGFPVCTALLAGSIFESVAVSNVVTGVAATHTAVGSVDIYRFTLPTGGAVTLPCVVLRINNTTADPCDEADGTFVSRLALLFDESADQPSASLSGTLVSARVCFATASVTVSGIGVQNFPAYTLC